MFKTKIHGKYNEKKPVFTFDTIYEKKNCRKTCVTRVVLGLKKRKVPGNPNYCNGCLTVT